ncbi:MMPL family transporter [Streptomyces californicus]|uniref:MMPL family transporter n=1 Tax=Streptomyces californicus TaxID=67351 RepID=UPI0037A29121
MLTGIAELALRRTRLLLVIASVAIVLMGALGVGAFGKLLSGGFDDPDAPSARAQSIIDEKFGGETDLVLLVRAVDGSPLDSPAVEERGRTLTEGLKKDPKVGNVISYWDTGADALTSEGGDKALVLAHVNGDENERADLAAELIEEFGGVRNGVDVQAGGLSAIMNDVTTQVGKDLAVAEAIAVPITLILLVLAFGSVVAALLPLVIGMFAVMGTFAQLFVIGSVTDVSVFAINLTTALGLGLGIDYALLLVSRFREQLAAGAEVDDALRRTVQTAGRTIVFSAATVVAALAALLIFPPFFLRSFAYAGIGVVFIAALSALFVIPPLLVALGPRVNKGRLPWAERVQRADAPFWGKLAALVMRRPALTALPVLALMLLVASPLLSVTFGTPDERVLPESAGSRQVATQLQEEFPGDDNNAVQIVALNGATGAAFQQYAEKVSRLDGVEQVATSTGSYHDGAPGRPGPAAAALGADDAQRLVVTIVHETKSEEAQSLAEEIRAVEPPAGTEVLVGGQDARLVDSKHSIGTRLPIAVGLIAVTTFILLFLFTGSIVQPLRALLLNAVSLTASVGVMVWIFEDGHLASWLGFTPQPLDTSMTVLFFCVAFGLSMDYEVFVTSRMKELHDAGYDRDTVVTEGLARTGRIVTVAAGLLSVSFFAFGTSKISFLMMFGIGSGLAVVVDALLVRGVLVPAAMRVLGDAAWYAPRGLRKLHDRIGLSEGDPAEHAERKPVPVA